MAASPLVASATATISDLSIAIYDFRADDGIAAGASWLSKGNGRAEVVCCDTGSDTYFYGMRSASFSSDRWENTIANGTSIEGGIASARRTSDGAVAHLNIDNAHFGEIFSGGRDDSSHVEARANISSGSFKLALQPGTEIHLTGMTRFEASLDLRNSDYAALSSELRGGSTITVQAAAGQNGLEFIAQPQGPDAFAGGQIFQTKISGSGESEGNSELHESHSFSYVIRNHGNEAQVLNLGLSAWVDLYANYPYLLASPVPESGSIAMALAGLLGLGWMGRRRKLRLADGRATTWFLGLALIPFAANAAPQVSAQGNYSVVDYAGEASGGFFEEATPQPFSAYSNNWFDASGHYQFNDVNFALNEASYQADGGFFARVATSTMYSSPSQDTTSSVTLDWSDTITNGSGQDAGASMAFSIPRLFWELSGDATFNASIWIEGKASPVWTSGMTLDRTAGGFDYTFTGSSIGLRANPDGWGNQFVATPALDWSIYLGPIAADESLKVHFKVDLSVRNGNSELYFGSSAPVLNLSPVPEPSSVALVLAGAGLIGWQVRRRSRPGQTLSA